MSPQAQSRDERHEDCAEFFDRAAVLLRSVGAAGGPGGLPALVRALRNGSAGPDGPDSGAAWARELVLLYDPPHGQLPDGPLRAPPLRP